MSNEVLHRLLQFTALAIKIKIAYVFDRQKVH
ncbi:hypothetical protein AREALGSMS7_00988 [Arenibacter algicola]|uniref:Uncharacterized protein n=1 Tax=Arenibacter algicola TaxID=616991 RepID=A0A221UTP4_9FLAO|nr:hypothetical protein AREALGSMS7_00988 [Arenibacter algicola]